MAITGEDRDYIVRTALGMNGADAAPEQHASTAHLILNRLKSDKFADNARDIVLHPGHFEPWGEQARELLAIKKDSPTYLKVAQAADDAITGKIPDPHNGGTDPIPSETRFTPTLAQASDPAAIARRYGTTYAPGQNNAPAAPAAGPAATPNPAAATPVPSITSDPAADAVARRYGVTDLGGGGPVSRGPVPPEGPPGTVVPTEAAKREAARMTIANPVAEAMPIVGPAATLGRAAVMASRGKEGSFGERYEQALSDLQEASRIYGEQYPVRSTVGELAGSLIGSGALAAKIPRLFGLAGGTVGSRFYQGAAGGAGMGILDALARGEDPLHGAVLGAGFGGGGPFVGEGARAATRFASDRLWPVPGEVGRLNSTARGLLTSAIEGETPASLAVGKQRMGEHGFLADVSPGLTDLAGGIADMPGPGKAGIREAYRVRAAQHGNYLSRALDDAFGAPVDVRELTQLHTEARAAAADPLYQQFRTMQVFPTKELQALAPRLEAAGAFDNAERIAGISGRPFDRNYFTGGPRKNFPTAEGWDMAKRGLDSSIDQALRSGDKQTAMELVKLKNELLTEVEKTPAGSIWKQARSEFADRSALIDNLERGQDTFLGGRSGMDKGELKEELSGLSGPELMARLQGARAAIDTAMNDTVRGTGNMRERLLAPNNQEKLKMLLGDTEGNKLIERLKGLSFIAEQDLNIRGNLATGASAPMRSARRELVQPQPLPQYNPNLVAPLSLIPPHIREALRPSSIIEGTRAARFERARADLAPILTTKAGPRMDDLLLSIQREAERQGRIGAGAEKASKLFTFGVTGPGAQAGRSKLKDTDIPLVSPAR